MRLKFRHISVAYLRCLKRPETCTYIQKYLINYNTLKNPLEAQSRRTNLSRLVNKRVKRMQIVYRVME